MSTTRQNAPKVSVSVPQDDPKPDQIVELFRHGARGPIYDYDDSWNVSQYGMLTAVGMRQQYILGKVLSQKYSDLLGTAYDYNQIYILSDTTPRCIQSALIHLYGIYLGTGPALRDDYPTELAVPPYQDPLVKQIADQLGDTEAVPYKEVPNIVEIVDKTSGYIFQGDTPIYCPKVAIWEIENSKDDKEREAWAIFNETFTNVNKYLDPSKQLKTADDVTAFGDTVSVDFYENKTLPGGISDPELVSNISFAFAWYRFHVWEGQLLQRQLNAFGPVQAILAQMAAYKEGVKFNKAAFFSGHDDNIYAVLAAFGVITEDCLMDNFNSYVENKTLVHPNCYFPYFASDLMFEFYNSTETAYVKFYFNNALIPLCNGQDSCSYEDFVVFANNATGNHTLVSYFEKCTATQDYLNQFDIDLKSVTEVPAFTRQALYTVSDKKISTELMVITGLSILCVMLLANMVNDKKKYKHVVRELENERRLKNNVF